MTQPIWTPTPEQASATNMAAFITYVQSKDASLYPGAGALTDYDSLYAWSIAQPEEFWAAMWRYADIIAMQKTGAYLEDGEVHYAAGIENPWDEVLVGGGRMAPPDHKLGPRWFTRAKLNFAENLLRHCHGDDANTLQALVFYNENGKQRSVTYSELWNEVAAFAEALCGQGVGVGDRVVAFMPNMPETVIAMLATASIGAIWSSCSPDFGVKGVVDRFAQIEPKLLICADGYLYNGKQINSLATVREIIPALPNIQRVVVVPYINGQPNISGMPGTILWGDFVDEAGSGRAPYRPEPTSSTSAPACAADECASTGACTTGDIEDGTAWEPSPTQEKKAIQFEYLPVDHPLYIMYSSGTTGLPKAMIHGAGGTLIQHLKELMLHSDLKRGDRVFYFTTCGWMMWNWLVSSLAVGATVVFYDGSPFAPENDSLWKMAEAEKLTHFGTSAKYIAMLEKYDVKPGSNFNLEQLRVVLSTGSPLSPESFEYVYREIKPDVQLASISGGTDIISCFALGCPTEPVYKGELQKRGLGMAVEIWDEDSVSLTGQQGELVCVKPFPSMPVSFVNDGDGAKYRSAYFEHFDGIWRHGDWAELTANGGLVMHGRSDATLNPGGVRIGTAEIYRVVEGIGEVLEALVIGQKWEGDTRIVLFVRMAEGSALSDDLRDSIRKAIRSACSPHHVPKKIIAVADIPRTISGKITELAVTHIVHGREVKNRDALANPAVLELYRDLPELQS